MVRLVYQESKVLEIYSALRYGVKFIKKICDVATVGGQKFLSNIDLPISEDVRPSLISMGKKICGVQSCKNYRIMGDYRNTG